MLYGQKTERYHMSKMGFMFVVACMALHAGLGAGAEIQPLEKGASIPELTLRTVKGEAFDVNQAVASKPAVLIFYRGGWCPYCTRHLAALQEVESKIKAVGYQILAISPDRPEKLQETLDEKELGYTLLSDSDMAAAKAFGLAFVVDKETREKYKGYGIDLVEASGQKHYMLPVPAVYVVDRAGKITYVFAEEDYKVRLEPSKLLKVLQPQEQPKAKKGCAGCC